LVSPIDAGISARSETSKAISTRANYQLSIEQKLSNLVEFMSESADPPFFRKLITAAKRVASSDQSAFLEIKEKFDLPQFYLYEDPVSEINQAGVLILDIGPPRRDPYEYDDSYFKKPQYRFFMRASVDKFIGAVGGQLRRSGHEALLFGGHNGTRVPLLVFGQLLLLSTYTYQIKPYSIAIP
jgi:hypothetical protein